MTYPRLLPGRTLLVLLLCLPGLAGTAPAQTAATGAISGRILNLSNGSYLNNVRITVENTAVATQSNEFGEYRLEGLPAGAVTVRAFHTGLAGASSTVTVAAGETVRLNFSLGVNESRAEADAEAPLVLETYEVRASREMNASAIAINEQRFAPSIKNVIAAEEFGDIAEGNVGEFVKFIPGVTIDYNAADARTISVRGLPSNTTPVSMDGYRLASAASSGANRVFELEQVSINNVARVEVTKSPTPDQPADSLGGSINLVSKRAFERAKAGFNYRAYLSVNSEETDLGRTPGPGTGRSRKVKPSFDFTYIKPVNDRFGFTITGLHSEQFNPQHWMTTTWIPVGAPGSTSAAGTNYGTVANPMMRNYTLLEGPKTTQRSSLGATFDWKPTDRDVLTLSGDYNYYFSFFANRNADWNVAGTGFVASPLPTYGQDFTQGGADAAQVGRGVISNNTNFRRKMGTTYNLRLTWEHNGPVWRWELGGSYSRATNHYRDVPYGHFNGAFLQLRGQVLRFDDVNNGSPGAITSTSGGQPVDINDLGNYTLGDASTTPQDSKDIISSARVSLQRDLPAGFPLKIKVGADVREQDRDIRIPSTGYSFVGADGIRGTADDLVSNLGDLVSEYAHVPFGLPPIQYVDSYKVYDLFRAHPEYFQLNEVALATNSANNSRKLVETITAGYVRLDARLLENRLWLVGGFRYERTKDDTYGVKNDIGATFVKNPDGSLSTTKVSTDPVVLAQLQFQERGTHVVTSYSGLYPSLNASYNLTDDLVLRLAYARTIGRPNFNEIMPRVTQPDPNAGSVNFSVINTGLKPWTADNLDASLEYYFGKNGNSLVSVGAFQKDISDFFEATPALPVDAAFYEAYGIDPQPYLATGKDFTYTTKSNGGDAKVTGFEFNYRQALTFLPEWARGVQIFANYTSLELDGSNIADFNAFIPRSLNWGISLSRPDYVVKLNWNHRGRQRLGQIASTAANGVEPGTYDYVRQRLTLDLTAEAKLYKGLSLFVAARNITNESQIRERYGPSTPDYARRYRTEVYGVQFTLGVKGSF